MYVYMYAYKKLYRIIHARETGKNEGQKEECDKKKYVFYLFWFGEFIVHRLLHVNVLYYHKTHTYNVPNVSVLVFKNSNRIFWCYNEDLRKTIYRIPIRTWEKAYNTSYIRVIK